MSETIKELFTNDKADELITAITSSSSSKIEKQQGVINKGKALFVGNDGNVAAKQIEGSDVTISTGVTLTQQLSNLSGTIEEVSGDVSDLKGDLEELEPGLSAEAKRALLNCFAHVVWSDSNGQTYYDTLKEKLIVNPFEDAEYKLGGFGYNVNNNNETGCVTINDTLNTRVRVVVPVSCISGKFIAKDGYEINIYMLNSTLYGDWEASYGAHFTGWHDMAYYQAAYYSWSTEKQILDGTNYVLIVARKVSGEIFTQEEVDSIYGTAFEYVRG